MSRFLIIALQALFVAALFASLVPLARFVWRRYRKQDATPADGLSLRVAIASGAGVIAILAGGYTAGRAVGFFGPGTPACAGVVDPTASAAQAALAFNCGEGLDFQINSHGSVDVQFLDSADATGRAIPGGPAAAILPEQRAHRNPLSSLESGRIVARVWVDPNYLGGAGYPKLGFGPGINYIWIDTISPPAPRPRNPDFRPLPDDTIPGMGVLLDSIRGESVVRGRFRAVVIPAGGQPVSTHSVNLYDRSRMSIFAGHNHAIARWIHWPQDIGGWVACTKHGCCSIDDPN